MLDKGKRPLAQAFPPRIEKLGSIHNLGEGTVLILAGADSHRAGLKGHTMRRVVGRRPLLGRLGNDAVRRHIGQQARNLAAGERQAVRVRHVVTLGKLSGGELGVLLFKNLQQKLLDFGVGERLGARLCVLLGADTLLNHLRENGGYVGVRLCERVGGDGEGLNLRHGVLLGGHGLTLPFCPSGRWWGSAFPCPVLFSMLGVRFWFVKCRGVFSIKPAQPVSSFALLGYSARSALPTP